MRITESRLRRIIRSVIAETIEDPDHGTLYQMPDGSYMPAGDQEEMYLGRDSRDIECVIKYKDGRRFDGSCTVKKLMDDIMSGAMNIQSVMIDEMHSSAEYIKSICMEKGVSCIAGVM